MLLGKFPCVPERVRHLLIVMRRILIVVITVFYVKACLADPNGSTFAPKSEKDVEAAEPKVEAAAA